MCIQCGKIESCNCQKTSSKEKRELANDMDVRVQLAKMNKKITDIPKGDQGPEGDTYVPINEDSYFTI